MFQTNEPAPEPQPDRELTMFEKLMGMTVEEWDAIMSDERKLDD